MSRTVGGSRAVAALLGCAIAVTLALAPRAARGAVFTVTAADDGSDADLDDDVCAIAAGPCTLRAAIEQANATAGADTIGFAIAPFDGTVKTIAPGRPLPALVDPAGTLIDGFSQDDAAPNTLADGVDARLRIEIDGSAAGDADGLILSGGNNTVRGLVVNRFARNGIGIVGGGGNRIEGNFIGTDAGGVLPRGNAIGVLVLASAGHTIGGSLPAARNVIGGNVTGVSIDGGTDIAVAGNFIGLAADGVGDLGNEASGVVLAGPDNRVGGTTAAERNVISGNDQIGVLAVGATATGNAVEGNYIGTDASGTAAVPNPIGVELEAPANRVGGPTTAPGLPPGNVIVGSLRGIRIPVASATGNAIQGNLIGTDAAGTARLVPAPPGDGIEVLAAETLIGGPTTAERNVVAGHANGLTLASGVTVQGNCIGTDVTGTVALGNERVGIEVRGSDTLIGGAAAGGAGAPPGNLVAGNQLGGIHLADGAGNAVQGNAVGVGIDGATPLPNGSHGIAIGSNGVEATIGGAADGEGNAIAFNGGHGVLAAFDDTSRDHRVEGNRIFANAGTGVIVQLGRQIAISRNALFDNGGLGIDLVGGEIDGPVTHNDAGDADVGSNQRQNFPDLAAALPVDGGAAVSGTLDSTAQTAFTLEFFVSDGCDPSGFGEGAEYLGAIEVETGADGLAPFEVFFADVAPGRVVTATATDPLGNTSELSACPVVAEPTPTPTGTMPPSPTATRTGTPTRSGTPTGTATHTHTATSTPTPTATGTALPSDSPTAPPSPTAPLGPCPGDCDGDRVVEIAELILAVNIALGTNPIDDCPAIDTDGDRRATITELVRAVRAALDGC